MHTGLVYATLAYLFWGLFPLYFRVIPDVPPLAVVLHRSVWSLLFVFALLAWNGRWRWLGETLRQPRRVALFSASALLLSCNWLVYVLAVQSGRVIEASLGYFINPLVSIVLGVLVLRERLRPLHWLAVALAACGVLWLTWQAGRPPWIALVLAGSFGLYGLLRKTAPLGALQGLALENLLLMPLVLPVLAWWALAQVEVMPAGHPLPFGWLMLGGPLTALPLLLFAAGARRLPLSTVGMIQYLAPTLQLLLGVWVFHEPFDSRRLLGFGLIWSALLIVSADALRTRTPEAVVH